MLTSALCPQFQTIFFMKLCLNNSASTEAISIKTGEKISKHTTPNKTRSYIREDRPIKMTLKYPRRTKISMVIANSCVARLKMTDQDLDFQMEATTGSVPST